MNTVHLQYFLEIVKSGSINKAAQKLFLNHSSLVYALNELEKEIGQKLLIRNKAGITLTEAGKQVFEDAQKMLSMMEAWSVEEKNEFIPVTLNAIPCMYFPYLDDIVLLLINKWPKLRISTNLIGPYEFEKSALCLSGYYSSDEHKNKYLTQTQNITEIPLFKSKLVLYMSHKHPLAKQQSVSLSDVRNSDICVGSHSTFEETSFSKLYDKNKIVYINSLPQITKLIVNSERVTILPPHLKYFPDLVDPEKIKILPIEEYQEYFYCSLYASYDDTKSILLKSVIDTLTTYPYTEKMDSSLVERCLIKY